MSSDDLQPDSPLNPDAPICYTPKHINEQCLQSPCPSHTFEDSQMSSTTNLYQQGRLPLILCMNDVVELQSDDLRAHHARRYVAISHVRSQGLGNSYSNSLPMCQILRLQSLVNELYPSIPEPVPFWIDTLCIPLTAPGQYLALEALYNIFRHADATIVLENSVCNTPARSAEQNMIKIKESQWAQRLWTIREGAIAKSLKIQFKDSALDMLEIIKEYSSAPNGRLVSHPRSRSNSSDGIMSKTNVDRFIDQLQLLERDLRAAIDKIPPPTMTTSYKDLESNQRMEKKVQIRVVLRQCYLSVPLYRYFATVSEAAGFLALQTIVDSIYNGLTYDKLLNEQKISPAGTLVRLDTVRSRSLNSNYRPS